VGSRVKSGVFRPRRWCFAALALWLAGACAQGDSDPSGRADSGARADGPIAVRDGGTPPPTDSGRPPAPDGGTVRDAGPRDGGAPRIDAGRDSGPPCECTPGATFAESEGCACGGTRTRTRTCGADCAWGAWGSFGACTGATGTCTPGMTRPCANGDTCGVETCSASCTWGACAPATPGGCLRIRPGTSGPAGNNYRCCTSPPPPGDANGMGWQFCLPSCSWSSACEATTAC
jgi:hypothetical protein